MRLINAQVNIDFEYGCLFCCVRIVRIVMHEGFNLSPCSLMPSIQIVRDKFSE